MKRSSIISSMIAIAIMSFAIVANSIFIKPVAAVATTTTIIGWNVPDATHIGYALVAFLLPLVITGLFLGIASALKVKGPVNSWLIKVGLLIGSILGMLSLTAPTATSPSDIPFAIPVIAAIYLITYAWKGV